MTRKNSKKEEIVENAVKLFYELGYENCTLRVIAEKTGITHRAILKHFNNKYELASIVVERYLIHLVKMTENFLTERLVQTDDNFDIVLFYWCTHHRLLMLDEKFRKFYLEFYFFDNHSFIDIHAFFAGHIFINLFKFDMQKESVFLHVDNCALAGAEIALIQACVNNELSFFEMNVYLLKIFMKLIEYDHELSELEIENFLNRNVLCNNYGSSFIFEKMLT